jgi:hypothetical protein
MRKRIMLLLALASSSLIALLLWVTIRDTEPRYQDKNLSSWLYIYSCSESIAARDEAKEAISHFGSNAAPYLLRSIRYVPPNWRPLAKKCCQKLATLRLARAIIPSALVIDTHVAQADCAVGGFRLLGQKVAAAFPELARLACDASHEERADRAIQALLFIRPPAAPALAEVLSNAPPKLRFRTINYLNTARDPELLRAMLPSLVQGLHDEDAQIAISSTLAIMQLRYDPGTLPILSEATTHPNPRVRAQALMCIATFETAAAQVAGCVALTLNDSDANVRREGTNTLRIIAPEILKISSHK